MVYTTGGFISNNICLRKKNEIISHIKLILYANRRFE